MAADIHENEPGKTPARSRPANDLAALPGVDGRSGWARRFRDVTERIVADAGGSDLSEQQRLIVRRAATLALEAEALERRFANAGEATPEQLALYASISGTIRRLLADIGLQKRGPDPWAYLKQF